MGSAKPGLLVMQAGETKQGSLAGRCSSALFASDALIGTEKTSDLQGFLTCLFSVQALQCKILQWGCGGMQTSPRHPSVGASNEWTGSDLELLRAKGACYGL
mmetsp:Transcript_5954/g.9440  ORF Transcript_5954/g.9440 Transcript_5954/m.9440 type:complete len:102 (+) Transcript_5954:478-783(+)